MVDTITTTGNVDITGDLQVSGVSIFTNDVSFNDGNMNIDTANKFDTIVIRKQIFDDVGTTNVINLTELQCWVNGNNLLGDNHDTLITMFLNWDTKEIGEPIADGQTGEILYASNIHYTDLTDMAHNSYLTSNAIIINNIPLTTTKDIQSIVFYNRVVRSSQSFLDRAIDLTIEFYDSRNDPEYISNKKSYIRWVSCI